MTSRSIHRTDSTSDAPRPAGPGDRPHLPPVESSRRTDRKTPLGWLPWLLLGLLLLTLLAVALLARAAGGTDTDRDARSNDSAAAAGQNGSAESAALSAGVSASEGADQLIQQGGYVEATEVRLAS